MYSQLWKTSAGLWIVLALAGCIASPSVPGGEVLPAEAQRVIDRATATAGAVATQSAFATATRVSDLERAEAQRTAAADAFLAAQQAATLQALNLQQAVEGTRAAVAGQQAVAAATHTQAAANVVATQQAQRAAFDAAAGNVATSASLALLGLALVAALGLLARLAWARVDAWARQWRGEAAFVNTPYGPAQVEIVGGLVRLTLLAPPHRPTLPRPEAPAHPAREFFVGKDKVLREEQMPPAEESALRAELVAMVQAAISANGGESNIIPRHSNLGIGAEKRGRLVGALVRAGLAMVDKSGTTLAGQRTLFTLLTDLQAGLSLRPVEVVNVQ